MNSPSDGRARESGESNNTDERERERRREKKNLKRRKKRQEERKKKARDRLGDYDDRRGDKDGGDKRYDDRHCDYDDNPRDNDGGNGERSSKNYGGDKPLLTDERRHDFDDRRHDFDDRHCEYDDRRSNSDDRHGKYDDRRRDYYDNRPLDFDDRRRDYDNRGHGYDNEGRRNYYISGDRRDGYNDRDLDYDDDSRRRRDEDVGGERWRSRSPSIPPEKKINQNSVTLFGLSRNSTPSSITSAIESCWGRKVQSVDILYEEITHAPIGRANIVFLEEVEIWELISSDKSYEDIEIEIDGNSVGIEPVYCGENVDLNQSQDLWPTPFETSGGSYVLDPNSGYFYEAKSMFYFDPKTKTYYGNEGRYWRYDPLKVGSSLDTSKGFYKVEGATERKNLLEGDGEVLNSAQTEGQAKAGKKRKIAVKLSGLGVSGGKKRKDKEHRDKKEERSEKVASGGHTHDKPADKKIGANIDKWNFLKHSLKQQGKKERPERPPYLIICKICERKFKSKERLERHERKSDMHKENLKRRKNEGYIDRNLMRKTMVGAVGDAEKGTKQQQKRRKQNKQQNRTETREEDDPFDPKTNIGSAILAKMIKKTTKTETQVTPVHEK